METPMRVVSLEGIRNESFFGAIPGFKLLSIEDDTETDIRYPDYPVDLYNLKFKYGITNFTLKPKPNKFSLFFESYEGPHDQGFQKFVDHSESFFPSMETVILKGLELYRGRLLSQMKTDFEDQIFKRYSKNRVSLSVANVRADEPEKPTIIGLKIDVPSCGLAIRVLLGYDFLKNHYICRLGYAGSTSIRDTELYTEVILESAIQVNKIIYEHL